MATNDSYKKWHGPAKDIYGQDGKLKKGRTHQGFYIVRNKSKYVGDLNLVIYRSAWEFSFCKWCDFSPSILRWSSEPVKIPYYDKVSKLEECKKLGLDPNNPANWIKKNYNTDFWIEVQKPDETIEKWLIEIKPKYKLARPKPVPKDAPLKDQKKFNKMAKEYILNESKFEAMKAWADQTGTKFYIFTEDQLRKFGIIGGRFDLQIDNKRNFDK
jgi:hypothetical protein